MSIFRLIILSLPTLDIIWWIWAHRRLRGLPHARFWRTLLALFAGGNIAILAWVFISRLSGLSSWLPSPLLGMCYVWHLVVLPATTIFMAGDGLYWGLRAGGAWLTRLFRSPRAADPLPATIAAVSDASAPPASTGLTRRQILAAAVVAVPPLATALGEIRAVTQLNTFRIRRFNIDLPTLPPALDGLSIAHVSDLHVGRFTHGRILDDVVARTKELAPDIVVFTGDLIDYALTDLPTGLEMLKKLAPPERLFVCEGNHDLFQGREEFEQRMKAAGVTLLLNESALTEVCGQPVQVLGLRWGPSSGGRRGWWVGDHVGKVLPLRKPNAFTMLLSHHPDAFDPAAEAGIPLTLAGHTHGGQFMLTQEIGAGPALFKYWSGLYRDAASALVVSNGVGNWFPLRINAPAEIVHLTLRTTRRA